MSAHQLEATFERLHELHGNISRAVANLQKIGVENFTVPCIEGRRNALQRNWVKFQEHHETAVKLRMTLSADQRAQILKLPYYTEDVYEQCEEAFLIAEEHMNTLLRQLVPPPAPVSPPSAITPENQIMAANFGRSHRIRLPRIDLPKFNGAYSDWTSFRDLFTALIIENESLTDVERLQYLKTHITGIAGQKLKSVALTSANFRPAWTDLTNYYDNNRLLVNAALHAFFTAKPVTKESSKELERLYSEITQALSALEALERPVDESADFVVYSVSSRLDAATVKEWERHLGDNTDPPTWNQLKDFLVSRIRALEAFERSAASQGSSSRSPPGKGGAKACHTVGILSNAKGTCALCNSSHYIASCPSYKGKTPEQRREIVISKGLCFNCLGPHRRTACRTPRRCQVCGAQHHTSIHSPTTSSTSPSPVNGTQAALAGPTAAVNLNIVSETPSSVNTASRPSLKVPVILATAKVQAISPSGERFVSRVLLDQGSEISIVTESFAQRLRLPRARSSLPLVGIGADCSRPTNGEVKVTLISLANPEFSCRVSAAILPQLTGRLPSIDVSKFSWPHLQGLQLADPEYTQPGKIDILLGADVYAQILQEGLKKGPVDAPIAQKTHFGWILSGPCSSSDNPVGNSPAHSFHCSPDRELSALMEEFWLQEKAFSVTQLSQAERQCEEHFASTHSRNATGSYIVRLPLKRATEDLGDSRAIALRALSRLEKRFSLNTQLRQLYDVFLSEYETLGHMSAAIQPPQAHRSFYLPHHGVLRENFSPKKLRVVFNGSQPTSSNVSLNDCLHSGPKLQNDLADVLLRWRQYPFAFGADIVKMYRQILVHPDDWDLQRIIWRKSPAQPPQDYVLQTVTYGLSAAPYLALKALQQLATDDGHRFPEAVACVRHEMYVDNLFSGAGSLEDAQEKLRQINGLLTAGGFPLQQWIANHREILAEVPSHLHDLASSRTLDDKPLYRTLGLSWQPERDVFAFTAAANNETRTASKRSVLSDIARQFDPLGWLAPVIITAKIFMQELWDTKLDWDDRLRPSLAARWSEYLHHLQAVSSLTVPRWLSTSPSDLARELHGFADASKSALGIAIYLRVTDENGDVHLTLVSAKTKVAPRSSTRNKQNQTTRATIPRLELCAAVLLVRQLLHVMNVLNLQEAPVHLWTDSSTVYYWISGQASRWKDFVKNRVVFIQNRLPQGHWHHVAGQSNPADCASRGLTPHQLAKHRLWWNGPDWLSQHPRFWPSVLPSLDHDANLEERPKISAHTIQDPSSQLWDLVHRYSSIIRLLRVTATCLRAALCFRNPRLASDHPLTPSELDKARLFWIKAIQEVYFASEIAQLSASRVLLCSNRLVRLTPFLDSFSLLRVGGRLQNSLLDANAKTPLILPRDSPLTTLLIREAHLATLHGGTQITLATLRQNYWIIGGRAPVRSYILRCVSCARQRATTAQQLMGQLPSHRVQPSRAFLHSGIDYAGPITLKTWKGRAAKHYKGYIALFVCLSTSAVHLELVTDYTSEAFLAAFKRFTGRRGICATLLSDCGTTLVGANTELRRLFHSASRERKDLATLLANDGTEWRFNPPSAPHFGGKWEAGVKSVKYHLKRVIGDTVLTYEEYSTLIIQVEAVLNSRPLTPLSDDPSDVNAITPGHFLIGSALNTPPEPSLIDISTTRLSRWQLLRQLLESFWNRWSSEYLQRLQAIAKWQQPHDTIQPGTLVLVKDERYPPSKWPLARVISVHPGQDGLVRVATVKTHATTLTRPIVKLCPLPVTIQRSSSPEPSSDK